MSPKPQKRRISTPFPAKDGAVGSSEPHDEELERVAAELSRLEETAIASVFRRTFDQIYDGQRTGRFSFDQLYKTEKTHFGTLIEINLQHRFAFSDGRVLDFEIGGVEVDCKYSKDIGGWMIPEEARGRVCLLLWASDLEALWSLGIVRASEKVLNLGINRDRKATLNEIGRQSIHWIFNQVTMPANILLRLDRQIVDEIMSLQSGQKRVNELFRRALGYQISRQVVATVARQDDYMKRVRENGGARSAPGYEGIIILDEYKAHTEIAEALGFDSPGPSDSLAVRLTPATSNEVGTVKIDGAFWKVAGPGDPIIPAPRIPRS